MIFRSISGRLSAAVLLTVVLSFPLPAQDQWSWPEKPENLQVLPKDWSGSRLRAPMTGFTRALGVRCSYCHKGEEGQPLSTYDFASDENPNKARAREMLRMLGSINEHLNRIEPSGEKRVNMWCHTCHKGRPRPTTLAEELEETYAAKGLEAAMAHYTELKESYYGRGAYNFESESTLNGFGYTVLGNKDANGAIRVFRLNAEKFPESANVWDSLAEAYMKGGETQQAIANYRKSLELDPNNSNAVNMLKKLEEKQNDE